MTYVNLLKNDKKNKTFMDYEPGDLPKKESATAELTPPENHTEKEKDPFLEGFNSVSREEESERNSLLGRTSSSGRDYTLGDAVTSKPETGIKYLNNKKLFDGFSNMKNDAFLEGFNKESEDEKDWKSMLGGIKDRATEVYNGIRAFGDNVEKSYKSAKKSSLKEDGYPRKLDTLEEIAKFSVNLPSTVLNKYGKLDDAVNIFTKKYDDLQDGASGIIPRAVHWVAGGYNYNKNKDVKGIPQGGANEPYINVQGEGVPTQVKYGVKNLDYNGCGVIAVYNSLKTLDDHMGLADVANRFDEKGQMAFGLMGTNANEIGDFFKERGYDVKERYGEDIIKYDIPEADTHILFYLNSENLASASAHIVSVQKLPDGTYAIYNGQESYQTGKTQYVDSIKKYMDHYGFIPISLHSISKK